MRSLAEREPISPCVVCRLCSRVRPPRRASLLLTSNWSIIAYDVVVDLHCWLRTPAARSGLCVVLCIDRSPDRPMKDGPTAQRPPVELERHGASRLLGNVIVLEPPPCCLQRLVAGCLQITIRSSVHSLSA